jgi:NAD(P)-dependent dehydrogenase (short-subunit alcohol dehydrogenase family)
MSNQPTTSARFANRTAIVTGGARGIGLAIAERLAGEGARIAIWDVDLATAQESAKALGAGHVALAADVSDEAAVGRATEATYAAFGRVDALVNNAGILGPVAPIWEQEPAAFKRVMDVNLTGTYLVCRAVVPRMRAQAGPRRGAIVNLSSVQGKEGMALSGAYGISKAGVMALTKALGKELAKDGIFVNCVTPAAAETDMFKEMSPERRADILSRIPMGRFVRVDEIAAMVAFLASDDCSFSTGAAFDLSGGRATY